MLKSVRKPDGSLVSFEYDALGRRTSKTVGEKINRFLWDGNVLLHEWDLDKKDKPRPYLNDLGELIKDEAEPINNLITWVYDNNNYNPSAKIFDNEVYSIVNDYLGTPVQVYNNNGILIWERELDIYGKIRKIEGDKNLIPFLYQGQYYDEDIELAYNRFRYYDPNSGTYLSQDPIGLEGNNQNFYAYVPDNNIWIDIFGCSFFNPIAWDAPSSGTGYNYTVYQQNIDWDKVDSKGRTNLERSTKGLAPLGNDGKSINLHHSNQNAKGPLFEVSDSIHKKYDRTNALHPYKVDGTGKHPHNPVDRKAFDTDRGAYWRSRAKSEKVRRSKLKAICK